jgi:hypothetical protein
MVKFKNFLSQNWIIIIILFVALFLRIFRLRELTTFSGDQGIDLLVVKRMLVDHQWTLLGPKTSIAPIFNGPIYYYLLLPFLAIFHLDPLGASYLMILLYLGAIFLIYLFGKEFINKQVGILASLFFAIWPVSVEYSRVSFNSFPTPFFAILFLYSLARSLKNYRWVVLSGFCFGIMMQLHYLNFFLGVLGLIWLILKTKLKVKTFFLFLLFSLIGFSPMILFEMRHNFFNTKTLLIFLTQKGIFSFKWKLHYFISFFPVIFLILGLFLNWLLRKKKIFGIFLILFLIYLNLSQVNLFRKNGYTMPEGWNMIGVQKVAKIINQDVSEDKKNKYEIAAILDGDTRAYPYRYFLEIMGKKPLGVEDYPQAEILYVVGKGESNFILSYPVWEIYTFLPAQVDKVWEIQNNVKLFKLVKKK